MDITDKEIVTIQSGEYYVTSDPRKVIYTILGSCVSVCLFDKKNGLGAMNHFMLPRGRQTRQTEAGLYGPDAMELIISGLVARGAQVANLQAKVFGGGRVLDIGGKKAMDIAAANVDFILNYLKRNRIPISAQDLGGTWGRKIFYFIEDHGVYQLRF